MLGIGERGLSHESFVRVLDDYGRMTVMRKDSGWDSQ